ncbi:Kinase-like protein [Mycena venus]|uniref:Kinase-like protein n=1 Tax=Mycena venus TaxID=2733690 RepID=A0A8H7CPT3_9AGAR|nr:Kinase-like protein [Mycena venus]
MDEERVDRLLLETAEGLRYLHSMNIVHGDLRGNNILISDDFSVCLSDFGLANIICDNETTGAASSSNHAGSTRWFAPELIRPTAFGCDRFNRTPASDMYAFGCVCYELYTGSPPFSDVTPDMAAMLKVMEGERPGQPAQISDALWTLITTAWGEDWRQRPTAAEIIVLFPVSTPAHSLQIEQSKSSNNNIAIPVSDSGHHTQAEPASDLESSNGTSIKVSEEDPDDKTFLNAVPTIASGAQAIHIPKPRPTTGSLRSITSIELLDPLDLNIAWAFATTNNSEQEYLPPCGRATFIPTVVYTLLVKALSVS